jgi:hypothetical protein
LFRSSEPPTRLPGPALPRAGPSNQQFREHDPVCRDRRFLGWIVSRYDVQNILRDPTVSSRRDLAPSATLTPN